ncbi:MAG: CvpA family protein [Nitrospinae bacterium]|nr:CvpA family protein [Nitrospinota bacterium]
MSIYWFDLVAGVLLLVFAGFGWIRGLVKEFFFTAAWAGGYLAALFFYRRAARLLKGFITFAPLADLAGFLILFAGVYLLARLLEYVVREKLGFKMPRAVDAPGGALMGLIKGFVMLAVFLMALGYWPPAYETLLANSWLMRWTRYLAHPNGPLGLDVRPSGELKNDINELKGKIPDLKELKEGLPPIPAIPEMPAEKLPKLPPLDAPRMAPAQAPPSSPKTALQQPAVSPPQPASPKKPPPVPAPPPRVKQVEPVVKKNRPEAAVPPEDEARQMDKFIKSID